MKGSWKQVQSPRSLMIRSIAVETDRGWLHIAIMGYMSLARIVPGKLNLIRQQRKKKGAAP